MSIEKTMTFAKFASLFQKGGILLGEKQQEIYNFCELVF